MGIPGIGFNGIEGQKFDDGFEIETGLDSARDVSAPDMLVWQVDLPKITVLRLDLFL